MLNQQNGECVAALLSERMQPSEGFLHALCGKIDSKKQLFVAYDPNKDLKNTSEETLNAEGFFCAIYVLCYFFAQSQNVGMHYKALNTLLNIKDIVPEDGLKEHWVQMLYDEIDHEIA